MSMVSVFGALAACGDGGASHSEGLHYVAVLPLSGPLASIGEADKAAVEAAVDVANANGGTNGEPIELSFVDSTGTATEAVSALQKKLSSGDQVDFVHAGATSTEAMPMQPILTKAQVPSCTTASAEALDDPEKHPYAFGDSALSRYVAEAMVASLKELDYTKAAGVYPSTELGVAAKEAAIAATEKAGIDFETVDADPAATDLTSQYEQLKAGNPEVLVVDGFGPIAGVMLKTRAKMAWDVPVVGDDTFAVNNLGELVDETALSGVYLSTQALNVTGTPVTESSDFKEYQDALAKHVDEPTFAAEVYGDQYACVMLAVAAVEKAGSIEPEALKDAMESFKSADDVPRWFVTKEIGFSAENHFPAYRPEDYVTVKAGPRVNGLLVPKE
ncbi:ABC transporter substrate-binding protein [Nocardioides sp. NPDC051685]|uniref:ABC transporter substrate-binding protein n=1 Tax=Nocardioides sp. NPDC051685 TaxID=3364334 RepID=UPI0037926D91